MKITYQDENIQISEFNEPEAYQIARKIEHQGLNLYAALKENATDPELQHTLTLLHDQEREHLALIEQHLSTFPELTDDEQLLDAVDSGVIAPLVREHELAELAQSPKEVRALGLLIEKRSIAFYQALLPYTTEPHGHQAIEHLLQEEQAHLNTLETVLH